jgi:hypothetical protein
MTDPDRFESAYYLEIKAVGLEGAAARHYEFQVRRNLASIFRTQTGRTVFNAIRYYKTRVTIVPYDGYTGRCNAYLDGSVMRIFYSPDLFSKSGECYVADPKVNKGTRADERLCHELVHTFRFVSRRPDRKPMGDGYAHGGMVNYHYPEEFIAVLVTNIYISDPTNGIKTGLRASYRERRELSRELAGNYKFFQSGAQSYDLIERFCKENPGFTKALANVKSAFNPLAGYYDDPVKAKSYSKNATAVKHDLLGWIIELNQQL